MGIALGALLVAWIVIWVATIGCVHRLRPLCSGPGVVEVILGLLMRTSWTPGL